MGDGTDPDDVKKFTAAIEYWMTHDLERNATAQKAIEFVRARHSVGLFTSRMRSAILEAIQ
jgi:spore maturation protein CgeB